MRCDWQQVVITSGLAAGALPPRRCSCSTRATRSTWRIPATSRRGSPAGTPARGSCPGPIDDQGLLPPTPADGRIALIYTTPSRQFPTGVSLSLARRLALIDFAGRTQCWIVEDDYDSELRYGARPLPSLQSLDNSGRVIYAGTFSKLLFPSLRLGYVVVPEPLLERFVALKHLNDDHLPLLDQATLALFLESGAFYSHVRRCRREYAVRQKLFLDLFAEADLPVSPRQRRRRHERRRLPAARTPTTRPGRAAWREAGFDVPALSHYAIRARPRPGWSSASPPSPPSSCARPSNACCRFSDGRPRSRRAAPRNATKDEETMSRRTRVDERWLDAWRSSWRWSWRRLWHGAGGRAGCSASAPPAQPPAADALRALPFDHILRYDEFTALLQAWAAARPDLVELESLGKTPEGRELWFLTLTSRATGPASDKPAIAVDGNEHATEWGGGVAALHFTHHLLAGFGSDERVTRLLETRAVYVLPRLTPDGVEATLDAGAFHPLGRPALSARHAGEGIHARDLDGDGRAVFMRYRDPNGPWKEYPGDRRLLVPRAPDETGGDFWRVLPEGRIEGYDGATIADPPALEPIDLGANFPGDLRGQRARTHRRGVSDSPSPRSRPTSRRSRRGPTSSPTSPATPSAGSC